MDFLSQTYTALRGPQGAPQTAHETVLRLADRLSPDAQLPDRRAATQALKGLARAHRALVSAHCLPGLVRIAADDGAHDPEIARASLDAISLLVDGDAADARDAAARALAGPQLVHAALALAGDAEPAVRGAALALLGVLLRARPGGVQGHFLTAPNGAARMVAALEDPEDALAHEALLVLGALIRKNGEIQKVLAFDGVFEKLFAVVERAGGLEGGARPAEALRAVDALLRFNTSNQSYFLETPLPGALCALLYFDAAIQPDEPAPQAFALQFWTPAKAVAASLVLDLIGLLLSAKGPALRQGYAYARLLLSLALSSNAPPALKRSALRHLPADAAPLLPELMLTPYVPVPGTGGEEWDKLEEAPAVDVLLELVVGGEYAGAEAAGRGRDALELRAAAAGVFENFVRDDAVKEAVVAGMLPPPAAPAARAPLTPLLLALLAAPAGDGRPPDRGAVSGFQFAGALLAHVLRHAPAAKALAARIVPPSLSASSGGDNAFFVPADGGAPPPAPEPAEEEEDEDAQTLLQVLAEHLSLAFLARGRDGLSEEDAREWDRWLVAHLCLLAQWLWEDAGAVRTFLEAGGMGVLVEQLNLPADDADGAAPLPALCALLLGIAYEHNRAPGEITRARMRALLARLGPGVLAGRLARLRDAPAFRAVAPDAWVLPLPAPALIHDPTSPRPAEEEAEAEIWFDWAFVDFWKSVSQTVVRALLAEPDAPPQGAAGGAEESVRVAALREQLAAQAAELARLSAQASSASAAQEELGKTQARLGALEAELAAARTEVAQWKSEAQRPRTPPPPPPPAAPAAPDLSHELAAAKAELEAARASAEAARTELEAERAKRAEVEKEQEDLLVLLDEISDKHKRDKAAMRAAGMDVSEDEEEDDDGGDEEDEE